MKKMLFFIFILLCFLAINLSAQNKSTGEIVKDIDGNVYHTVKIGTQIWMVENLKTTKYRNGEAIPNVTDETIWKNISSGAYCNYNNDISNIETHGRLYNWFAVGDIKELAPEGWHIPDDKEWKTLIDFLGGENIASGKLKENGTSHWNYPNSGATNETGFAALPSGYRDRDGVFGNIGKSIYFWSATEFNSENGNYFGMNFENSKLIRGYYLEQSGFSVRCIKDGSSESEKSSKNEDVKSNSVFGQENEKEYETVPSDKGHMQGMTLVRKDDKVGYIDSKTKKVVIPINFDYLGDFYEGLAVASMNGNYGYINKKGEVVIPINFDYLGDFYEGLAVASMNGNYGYINKKGEVEIYCWYKSAYDFSKGLAIVAYKEDQIKNMNFYRYGIIDKNNNNIIPNEYIELNEFSDLTYKVSKLINVSKDEVGGVSYSAQKGTIKLKKERNSYMIDWSVFTDNILYFSDNSNYIFKITGAFLNQSNKNISRVDLKIIIRDYPPGVYPREIYKKKHSVFVNLSGEETEPFEIILNSKPHFDNEISIELEIESVK